MEKTIKIQWVEALRSGKYPQTKKTLRDANGYCCLGVLCDLVKDHDIVQGRWILKPGFTNYQFQIKNHTAPQMSFPGDEVLCLMPGGANVADNLATMNDGGKTFNEIATYIEENL